MPKDRVQRRGTGGGMRKTERMRNTGAIIASPFGDGALAAVATQHRTTGHGENG
jgi:hypothetical protein